MPNHPITPLASSQINHDHLKVELVEPRQHARHGAHRLAATADGGRSRSVSLTSPRRSPSCSHGRISCSPV